MCKHPPTPLIDVCFLVVTWHCNVGWSWGCVYWPQVNKFSLLFIGDGRDSPEQLCQGSERSMYLAGQGLNLKQAQMMRALEGKAGLEQTKDKVM